MWRVTDFGCQDAGELAVLMKKCTWAARKDSMGSAIADLWFNVRVDIEGSFKNADLYLKMYFEGRTVPTSSFVVQLDVFRRVGGEFDL